MPSIDPSWAGKVAFYELLFGTWTSYIGLVVLWQYVLRRPLEEWRYALLTFLGAGAFWVNHYFQHAPFWLVLINIYTVFFLVAWWRLGIAGARRGPVWSVGAIVAAFAYTVLFIAFEMTARIGVERLGMHEFCVMSLSFLGFVGLILWRGRASAREGN